jgi:hypothetical protein
MTNVQIAQKDWSHQIRILELFKLITMAARKEDNKFWSVSKAYQSLIFMAAMSWIKLTSQKIVMLWTILIQNPLRSICHDESKANNWKEAGDENTVKTGLSQCLEII